MRDKNDFEQREKNKKRYLNVFSKKVLYSITNNYIMYEEIRQKDPMCFRLLEKKNYLDTNHSGYQQKKGLPK